MPIRVGLGQDSHRFSRDPKRRLVLGGVEIPGIPGVVANSDGDVVLHALCNALAAFSGVAVLGSWADQVCAERGITDSRVFLREALDRIQGWHLTSASVSVECRRPHLAEYVDRMRREVASLLGLSPEDVMITATSGEGLTPFGEGKGIQAFAVVAGIREDLWKRLRE
jgi:2-C-methyl-D-erythritol 2,4-cyclodiphosphate synthase